MIEQKMKDLVETKQPMQFEAMLKTKRGKNLKWCQAVGEVVEENGNVVKFRGTFHDITERKKAEAALDTLLQSDFVKNCGMKLSY
ncbi:MAG: PAS domain-containing protein [Sedimentisphaerales bacterium]|nr:PAS domain-containing protein [Sedimentisphaerales bacterium]